MKEYIITINRQADYHKKAGGVWIEIPVFTMYETAVNIDELKLVLHDKAKKFAELSLMILADLYNLLADNYNNTPVMTIYSKHDTLSISLVQVVK